MLDALMSDFPGQANKRKAGELMPFLEAFIARKQEQIDEIMQVVERYEKKRAIEERAYQTMSPIRKLLSGKKPDHHLAVEYIHYVRKPMEQVKKLRQEMEAAQLMMEESGKGGSFTLSEETDKSFGF